jgi:nucleotide-binding universal stress UspA family protein
MSTRPVVVCVDGSAASMRAVRWAADEADRRRTELCMVHVVRRANEEDPLPAARRRVHQFVPKLTVLTETYEGDVPEVLLKRSAEACLLVAGSRGVGRPVEAVPNSTEAVLAMHSECPVVVVPGEEPFPDTGPVVVGVDGSALSEAAVQFAFDSAALRAAPLVAVHTWSDAGLGEAAGVRREESRMLADRLAQWQEKYPAVETRSLVVRDRPVRGLLEQAEGAQLLVVGSRGQGGLTGMLLGSTSTALVYCTPCPLAVVRNPVVMSAEHAEAREARVPG